MPAWYAGLRVGVKNIWWPWLLGAVFHMSPIDWSVVKMLRMYDTTAVFQVSAMTVRAPARRKPDAKLSSRARATG